MLVQNCIKNLFRIIILDVSITINDYLDIYMFIIHSLMLHELSKDSIFLLIIHASLHPKHNLGFEEPNLAHSTIHVNDTPILLDW